MNWRERWGLVIGASLVMWGVSERAFWSMFRPDDNVVFILIGILPYVVATYLAFLAAQYFRVSSVWGLVLIGALYGWLIEGIVGMTLYGAGGIPFPITISWTGLAWHMLLSAVVMLWFHHRALARSLKLSVVYAALSGFAWGLWSMTWFFETPPVTNTIPLYAVHVAVVVALMAFGHWLLGRRPVMAFEPPRFEWIAMVMLAALYFCLTIVFIGPLAITFPALLVLLYAVLRKSRQRHSAPLIFPVLTTRVPGTHIAMFVLTPAIATVFYALESAGAVPLAPVNFPIFIVTSALGALVFVIACVKVWRSA